MKSPRRAAPLLLLLTFGLAACGNQSPQVDPTKAQMPNEAALFSPGSMPVTKVDNSGLKGLSVGTRNVLTKEGWVEYTFSNSEKLLYRNHRGAALYGDVIYADSKDMPSYLGRIEDYISGKNKTSTQSVGLNPSGCSVRFFFCSIYTSAYLWAGKRVDYYYVPGWTEDQKIDLDNQVEEWNNSGVAIRWTRQYPTQPNDTWVEVRPVSNVDYCGAAKIGFQSRVAFTGANYINIANNSYCVDRGSGTMQHEMGHVIGLPHEQSRCDRDKYVTIGSGSPGQSDKACGDAFRYYTNFDYDSIMLYPSPTVNAKRPQPPQGSYVGTYPTGDISRKTTLTWADVQTVNGIYLSPANPRP